MILSRSVNELAYTYGINRVKTPRTTMKITTVVANARKRCFIVTIKGRAYEFPYSYLKHKPSTNNPVVQLSPDADAGNEAFSYKLKNGKRDTILAEQILLLNQDPEIVRKELLYTLTCQAQDLIKNRGLSKRSVARLLAIQPAQLYRLLDQTFYGKTIDQMVRLFSALGEQVEIRIIKSAA
jgi:predicted XRE-type DNA-binding protein